MIRHWKDFILSKSKVVAIKPPVAKPSASSESSKIQYIDQEPKVRSLTKRERDEIKERERQWLLLVDVVCLFGWFAAPAYVSSFKSVRRTHPCFYSAAEEKHEHIRIDEFDNRFPAKSQSSLDSKAKNLIDCTNKNE